MIGEYPERVEVILCEAQGWKAAASLQPLREGALVKRLIDRLKGR